MSNERNDNQKCTSVPAWDGKGACAHSFGEVCGACGPDVVRRLLAQAEADKRRIRQLELALEPFAKRGAELEKYTGKLPDAFVQIGLKAKWFVIAATIYEGGTGSPGQLEPGKELPRG